MIKILIALMLLAVTANAAQELSTEQVNRIADAIYQVEGGAKTRHPYGVLSVTTKDPRKVCMNTIRNNFARWQKSTNSSYIYFLADRYCPRSTDPVGNRRWKDNMTKILGESFLKQLDLLKNKN